MSTWIGQPVVKTTALEAFAPGLRRWHLEGLLPRTDGVIYAACGRSWTLSPTESLEHTDELDGVPEQVRCEACQAVFGHRITKL